MTEAATGHRTMTCNMLAEEIAGKRSRPGQDIQIDQVPGKLELYCEGDRLMIDTSGADWFALTPAEGRRLAEALKAMADRIEGSPPRRSAGHNPTMSDEARRALRRVVA